MDFPEEMASRTPFPKLMAITERITERTEVRASSQQGCSSLWGVFISCSLPFLFQPENTLAAVGKMRIFHQILSKFPFTKERKARKGAPARYACVCLYM